MGNTSQQMTTKKTGKFLFAFLLTVAILFFIVPSSAGAAWVTPESANANDMATDTVEYLVKYYHNGVYQPTQDREYAKDIWHMLPSASVAKTDLHLKKYQDMTVEKIILDREIVTSYPITLSKDTKHTIEVYYGDGLPGYTSMRYTLNYYQAGNTGSTPDDVVTRTVWTADGSLTTTVRQADVNTTMYDCQLFDAETSTTLPIKVKDGDCIDIRYKKDEMQVVEGSYIIQYMKEGVPADRVVVKKNLWAGDADRKLITVEASDFDRNKYAGYLTLTQAGVNVAFTDQVVWGTVVEANYQRDDNQKEDFLYGYNLYYWSENDGYQYAKTEWLTYEDRWIGEETITLTLDDLQNYRDPAGRIVIPVKEQLMEEDDLLLVADNTELVVRRGKTVNVYYDNVQQCSIVLKGTMKAASGRLDNDHFPIGVVQGDCEKTQGVFLSGEVLPTGVIQFTVNYVNMQDILGKELDFVIRQIPSESGVHEKNYIWDTSEYTVRVKFTQNAYDELEAAVVGSVPNIGFINLPK